MTSSFFFLYVVGFVVFMGLSLHNATDFLVYFPMVLRGFSIMG